MARSVEKDLAALAAINIPRITARYGSWDSVEKRVGFYETNAHAVFGKRAVSAMSRLVDKGLVRASWVEFSGLLYLFYEIRDASRPQLGLNQPGYTNPWMRDMRFKLNLPNDYGSEGDYAEAVAAAYGDEAPDAIDEVELREPIFVAAEESGLSFIRTTDYGAEWAGTAEQFEACRSRLPGWAKKYASRIDE